MADIIERQLVRPLLTRSYTSSYAQTRVNMEIPSEATLMAITDSESDKNMVHVSNIDELMAALNG